MARAPSQSHHNSALSLKQMWNRSRWLILGTSTAGALQLLVFVWDVSFCSALLPGWSRMDLAFLFTLSTFPLFFVGGFILRLCVVLAWHFRYSVSLRLAWNSLWCTDCPWISEIAGVQYHAWLFSIIVLFNTWVVAHAFNPSRSRWVFVSSDLVHIVSSRPVRTPQWDPASHINRKNKNKELFHSKILLVIPVAEVYFFKCDV